MVVEVQLFVVFTCLTPFTLALFVSFLLLVWDIDVFKIFMQLVKYETKELTAISLYVVWVENTQLSIEYLLRVHSLHFVKIRPVHHLHSWLKIPTKFDKFDQKIFMVKLLLIFTNRCQHIEKCWTGYQRL